MSQLDALVPIENARETILEQVHPLEIETVALGEAYQRTLARDVTSDIPVAPFDNTAMDGFAFKAADVAQASTDAPARLKIVAHIPAGRTYDQEVQAGECVRIMTGAALPDGVDTVEKIENSAFTDGGLVGDYLILDHPIEQGANVRHAGEEVQAGAVAMHAHTVIGPAALGLLASTGNTQIPVFRRPIVGVISLGTELVDATTVPGPGQIRNSNGPALAGCVLRAGCIPRRYPVLPDDENAIRATLKQAVSECDFVVSSGGASAGDFDFVTQIAGELGQVFFKYVNMRPGKSQTFAVVDGTPYLGLAGNPAAALVGFEMLASPALMKMQGRTQVFHPRQNAVLAVEAHKKGTRWNYQRATLTRSEAGQLVATPYRNQSSALFGTLQRGDCLVEIPGEVNRIAAGETVSCVRLDIPAGVVI